MSSEVTQSEGDKTIEIPVSSNKQDAAPVSATAKASAEELRLLEARRKADEAQIKLEKEKAKSRRFEDKVSRRESRKELILAFLTPKQLVWLLVAIVLLCGIFFIIVKPLVFDSQPVTNYLTESQLERVVCVSDLSTAEYVYNGIAEVTNEDGEVVYRIRYDSTVHAGIDMSDIDFEIDNDAMTITPVLPEIEIQDPVIDTSSFDFIPRNPDLELDEIISACKNDAKTEVGHEGQIYATAEDNLRSTIEALTLPLIENGGYTIQWDSDEAAEEQGNASADQQPTDEGAPTEKEDTDE